MNNMHPSLLLRLIGIDDSMPCARSNVRQFLSFFSSSAVYIAAKPVINDQLFLSLRGHSLGCLSCYQGDQSIVRGS
jgi:hypothetical protein